MKNHLHRLIFNRWSAFLHDLMWVPLSLFAVYLVRFNFQPIPSQYFESFCRITYVSVPVFSIIFWKFGLYRGIWRFASIPDLRRILKAVLLGALIVSLLSALLFRLENIPRTVLVLFPLLLIGGLAGPRLCYRLFKDKGFRLRKKEGIRTLVVGAGIAGEMVLRELISSLDYQPVALVDDDTNKHNREIHGVPVYDGLEGIVDMVKLLEIELVIFAIPSAGQKTVTGVIRKCAKAGVDCRTLPTLTEQVGKKLEIEQIRPFTLEDLLSRHVILLNNNKISKFLRNKDVMVTGCGGSIGSELCRQVARQGIKRLILFDHGEFNLYSIDNELRENFPHLLIVTVLGDVKNNERVDWVFKKFTPDVVFHAAAYKHVPMIELNPAEGVCNNVIGTKIVADAADRHGTERFVLVSTDKAVNPVNVMGATKRIAELYCQNHDSYSETKFITTRFGNVLGSAGSVVPLFERQIKEGGPVTVTHPKICRYFMTISESVSLILQAGAMGDGGEIFVLDMGKPVLIKDLAEQMISISGMEPGKDIEISYIGLRPGEKLFEEIFHESENLSETSHSKLLLARSRKVGWQWLQSEIEELRLASTSRDVSLIQSHLKSVVPEFKCYKSGNPKNLITN